MALTDAEQSGSLTAVPRASTLQASRLMLIGEASKGIAFVCGRDLVSERAERRGSLSCGAVFVVYEQDRAAPLHDECPGVPLRDDLCAQRYAFFGELL